MRNATQVFPAYYDPTTYGILRDPDMQTAYEAGAALRAQIPPAADDQQKVLAWGIDLQIDFVFPAPIGKLPVPNALNDAKNAVEWLYRNIHLITATAFSLDTHTPFMIFYPTWWVNDKGQSPAPYTIISEADVRNGKWMPIAEPEWSLYYVEQLESVGKKQLMIWPFHCMEGTVGRALVPELSEAVSCHSGARFAQPTYLTKGTISQVEFYSVLEPEVKYPHHPDGGFNTAFADFVASFDLIYVFGEARSHCVLETMNSVLKTFGNRPDILKKIRYLNDCTSSIPGFEKTTEAAIKVYVSKGVQLVNSTDPIA